jgi:hypothetical protein
MKTIVKLVTGAALASGLALAAAVPANAGVSIGIGIGGPGPGPYGGDWCARHPYRCNHYGGYYGPPPGDGVYVTNYGYWGGHGWYHHRGWSHGHWHYW